MSAKNVDKYNRFRSITVAFRVSPEEQKELNRAIALSGLPKQEYCYRKCMEREVVVQPSPRVYKALKTQMEFILNELQRIDVGGSIEQDRRGVQPSVRQDGHRIYDTVGEQGCYIAVQVERAERGGAGTGHLPSGGFHGVGGRGVHRADGGKCRTRIS